MISLTAMPFRGQRSERRQFDNKLVFLKTLHRFSVSQTQAIGKEDLT
jgi:hypothetical protein